MFEYKYICLAKYIYVHGDSDSLLDLLLSVWKST